MKYIKGLDGLRALAVILVIISHWFSFNPFIEKLLLGKIGVNIFFVISGFLITKILFHKRLEITFNLKSIFGEIKKFIARRTLRIFPIYYILLLFLYVTNGDEIKDVIVYYLAYISNYLFFNTQDWHGFMGHFWSLAVEEQFYLFWPLLIFFLNKNYIFKFLIVAIIFGTIYPYFFKTNMTSILTLSCINAFGIGALWSYMLVFKPVFKEKFILIVKYSFIPLLIFMFYHIALTRIPYFPVRLVTSIIVLRIIILCVEEPTNNYFFKLLNLRVMAFIGSISYGIYLYHNFIPSYVNRIFRVYKIKVPEWYTTNYKYFVFLIILISVSYGSWILIEKPFLKLKKSFK